MTDVTLNKEKLKDAIKNFFSANPEGVLKFFERELNISFEPEIPFVVNGVYEIERNREKKRYVLLDYFNNQYTLLCFKYKHYLGGSCNKKDMIRRICKDEKAKYLGQAIITVEKDDCDICIPCRNATVNYCNSCGKDLKS